MNLVYLKNGRIRPTEHRRNARRVREDAEDRDVQNGRSQVPESKICAN